MASFLRILPKLCRLPKTLAAVIGDKVIWPLELWALGVKCRGKITLIGRPSVQMRGNGEIVLGEGVKLFSRPSSNPLRLTTPCCLTVLKDGARIQIGAGSALSGTVICAAESVTIGERVLIGANCSILDTDFHPLDPGQRRVHQTAGAKSGPVVVEDDVFIGVGAIVLKGAVIGRGSVVGAGAVVAGEFAPDSLIVGNPARAVRQLKGAQSDSHEERV